MTFSPTDDDTSASLRYGIRLLIKHPNIDPARITDILQIAPKHSAIAGAQRTSPRGAILPGVHEVSVWSHSFLVTGNRLFFSDVVNLINKLEPHKPFLAEIVDGGGSIYLIVELPGDDNIGSDLSWHEMMRLGALKIDLGVEVFPDFN